MYYALTLGSTTIRFEARSEKAAAAEARCEIDAAIKAGHYIPDYHGPAKLWYYGPGEREVWQGNMFYGGNPTYEQRHEVAIYPPAAPVYTVRGTDFHGGHTYGQTDDVTEVVRLIGQHTVGGCHCGCVIVTKDNLVDGVDFSIIDDVQAAGISENQYQHLLNQGHRRAK